MLKCPHKDIPYQEKTLFTEVRLFWYNPVHTEISTGNLVEIFRTKTSLPTSKYPGVLNEKLMKGPKDLDNFRVT